MKLMIASDVHGSSYYCRLMTEAFHRERADRLLLLGDLLYHGPRNDLPRDYAPKEVIVMLNGMKDKILCVRGNCDTEVDQMVLEFPIMSDYALLWIDGHRIYATHGHKYNDDNLPPLQEGDILLYGHTHVPRCAKHPLPAEQPLPAAYLLQSADKGYLSMNPGSVSIPKENSANSYMIMEGREFIWKALENGKEFLHYDS